MTPDGCDGIDKKILESEYIELCKDWRSRDKYVLDKLTTTGILFALLGLALATVPEDKYPIKLLIVSIGTLFSFTLCVSIFKDVYYRDGTEKLLRVLCEYLCIKGTMENLKSQVNFQGDVGFPRKIRMYSRDAPETLGISPCLKGFFKNRTTFNWIFYFYFGCFWFFLVLTLFILFTWAHETVGPSRFYLVCFHILLIPLLLVFFYWVNKK